MVELLGMMLDFLDALAGAVTIAWWWCTWVSPNKRSPRLRTKAYPGEPSEIDRFLVEVRLVPAPGGYARDVGRAGPSATGSPDDAGRSL
jgi:hypothetical protein